MGTRSLVDVFMNERLGDIGGFEQKLKALVDECIFRIIRTVNSVASGNLSIDLIL